MGIGDPERASAFHFHIAHGHQSFGVGGVGRQQWPCMALIAGVRTNGPNQFSSFKLALSAAWEYRPWYVGRRWVWRPVERRDFWTKRWLLSRWDGFSGPLGISFLKPSCCFLPLSLSPGAHGLPALGKLAAHKWGLEESFATVDCSHSPQPRQCHEYSNYQDQRSGNNHRRNNPIAKVKLFWLNHD